jgi:hypothetical protein
MGLATMVGCAQYNLTGDVHFSAPTIDYSLFTSSSSTPSGSSLHLEDRSLHLQQHTSHFISLPPFSLLLGHCLAFDLLSCCYVDSRIV